MSARVFSDPEFLRQIHIQPFDYEADLAHEQFRIEQATYAYRMRCERLRREALARQAWFALLFAVVCFAAGFVGACL
jgi:hypothetical protein